MRPIVRIIGIVVSLAAFAFVGRAIYRSFDGLQQQFASPLFLAAVGGSVVAYALIVQLCSLAWHRLLTAIDGPSLSVGRALAICGKAQIYKYLPSNMLHMVGRYGLSRRAGASNKALAFAQIGELSIIAVAAACVSAWLARGVLVGELARHASANPALVNALVFGSLSVLILGVAVFGYLKMGGADHSAFVAVAIAFVLYLLFFIGSGSLIVMISRSLSGDSRIGDLIGIGAAAWLLGFIVPGAPGGFGVRETVLIAGLSTTGIPTAEATAVALGYRFATTIGDALVAVIVVAFECRK
ncbi:lysylphosphatidylglycerol synthase domain-containing protein [Rhizobium sp. BK251]|uniref:lysylphosphatidylglycerol synthase domain-containing protein n=1 Tax=Rhizobium sp. BK251 TaxID=2512125 RepID=UPI00104EE482|nr:lysylphosphatidylglycerol synthase domain-containing protein [Rhizobium sp. BK251]TCL70396.1 hypothetical protein EV286_107267 [Rhizobium sp. BK251]